jgi:hypothetical protein
MKIHLVTLIAPDLDYDIVDFWISHYTSMDIDTYTAFIHTDLAGKHPEVEVKLRQAGFKIAYAYGAFGDCDLRVNVMNGFASVIPEGDYILAVDSDEFQQWPEGQIKKHMEGIDLFEGYLIDCFGDELLEADPDIPLDVQYPNRAKHLEEQLSSECKPMKQTKVCIAKNILPVCFKGSHELNSDLPHKNISHRTRGTLDVLHYKWRKSAGDRLSTKWYCNPAHIETVIGSFENA